MKNKKSKEVITGTIESYGFIKWLKSLFKR